VEEMFLECVRDLVSEFMVDVDLLEAIEEQAEQVSAQ
jgi:hypothetical protein